MFYPSVHRFRRGLILTALWLFCAPPAIHAEPLASLNSASGLQLIVESELFPVPLNRIHSWHLYLADAGGNPVTAGHIEVRGGMPAHDHGLPTAPIVAAEEEPGRYLLQGIRFHMPGSWRLVFTIEQQGRRDVIEFELEL